MKLLGLCLNLIILVACARFSSQDVIRHKPTHGKFTLKLSGDKTKYVSKTVYNQTVISVFPKPVKDECKYNKNVTLHLVIVGVHCKGLYSSSEFSSIQLNTYFFSQTSSFPWTDNRPGIYWNKAITVACNKLDSYIGFDDNWTIIPEPVEPSPISADKSEAANQQDKPDGTLANEQVKPDDTLPKPQSKRDSNAVLDEVDSKQPDSPGHSKNQNQKNENSKKDNAIATPDSKQPKPKSTTPKPSKNDVARVPFMGEYIIIAALEKDEEHEFTRKRC